ncbi:MAG: hypothetical protein J6Q05_01385 [Elusimicrobiaceae bacterium]|nr:hypothetical protein [Elusimicrobiaceae bacterium]
MKKFLLVVLCLSAVALHAETIKMKDGNLITGSIIEQTEYVLKLTTSYGTITLNQKEIEQILPDKHRVILKGGSQLVGQIVDLDEFNLKLKTDDGAVVNIDMPQIVSVETYDYDRGQDAQKEFVEKTQEKEAAQAARTAAIAAGTATAGVAAAGGLTFDNDIDQVFDAQKATVVNGHVVTPTAAEQTAVQPAPVAKPMSDEEAFIKGVKTGAVSQQEYAAAAKEELSAKQTTQAPKAEKKAPKLHNEADYHKYFAVQVGAMPLDLKLDNSQRLGYDANDKYDVGGTSVAVSGKFLWRVKGSRFWVGPELGIGSIGNHSFVDKDPSVPSDLVDPQVKTSGQILRAGLTTNFYLNPQSRFSFYLTGSALYELLHLNYRGEVQSEKISSNGFAGAAGIGVETWIDDLMLGLEVREVFAQRQKELKDSSSVNTVIQAQLSWKF